MKDARFLILYLTISNIIFQTSAVLKPMNYNHFIINCVYSIVSILSLIVVGLSYKFQFFLNAMWPLSIVVLVRNSIRVLDLENTRYDPKNPENLRRYSYIAWTMLVVMQFSATMVILLVQVNCFANRRFIVQVAVFEIVLGILFLTMGFGDQSGLAGLIIQSLLGLFGLMVLCYYQYNTYMQVIKQTSQVISL